MNAAELPTVPLPTLTATPAPTPTPVATPIFVDSTPPPGLEVAFQQPVSSGNANNPGGSLVLGVMPVVLILAGIIVVHQLSHHRR